MLSWVSEPMAKLQARLVMAARRHSIAESLRKARLHPMFDLMLALEANPKSILELIPERNRVRNSAANRPGNLMVNRLTNQVTNRLINQVMNRLFNHLRNRLANQVMNRLLYRLRDRLGNRVVNRLVNLVANRLFKLMLNRVSNRLRNLMSNRLANQVMNRLFNHLRNRLANLMANHLFNRQAKQLSNLRSNQQADFVPHGLPGGVGVGFSPAQSQARSGSGRPGIHASDDRRGESGPVWLLPDTDEAGSCQARQAWPPCLSVQVPDASRTAVRRL
jgi:hypothetical protein